MNKLRKRLSAIRASAILVANLLMPLLAGAAGAENAPTIGADSIVVYNSAMEPVRKLANLPPILTCGNASNDSVVIGHSLSESLILFDKQGAPTSVIKLDEKPRRISGHNNGFLLVTERGVMADISPDGKFNGYDASQRPVNALVHPHQKAIIMLRAAGDIAISSLGGQVTNHYGSDNAGRSVLIRDIALEDNTNIVALDSVANEIITLDLSLREIRRTPAPFEVKQVTSIYSTSPSLTALFQDRTLVRFFRSDGSSRSYQAKEPISCAFRAGGDAVALGTSSQSRVLTISENFTNLDDVYPKLNSTSLFAIICYAFLGSLAFAYLWKRITASWRRTSFTRSGADVCQNANTQPLSRASMFLLFLAFTVSISGLYLSYWAYAPLRILGGLSSWGYYWLGALLSGLSLCFLGYKARLARAFPGVLPLDRSQQRDSVSWTLMALSFACVVAVHYLMQHELSPRWIVAAWIASQIFFVAAFTRTQPSPSWPWRERLCLLALLVITIATRTYKWLECPPDIHFDFGDVAVQAALLLYQDWYPIFELRAGQTIGRVWLLQMAASMWAFGVQEWAIRLPSLLWMVGLVWACYLLGRETISRRFGVIFAILVIAQHNLLAYSRLPYVIESTAPFVFCLYYCCRGVRRGAIRDWVVAGMWAGWSMMTVRTFTTFPFIGAAILLYFFIFHLRALWSQKMGIVAMVAAATIAFSPFYYFYAFSQHLSFRLAGSSPLLSNLKPNSDPSVWMSQMGAAFGAILRYPDRVMWPSESLEPICLALTGSLFGAGLVLLLLRARSLATPVSLFSMVGSIGLGSGFIANPPTYYHHFVGLVFVMYVVAIPLECIGQFVTIFRLKLVRLIFGLGICGATVLAAREQIQPFIRFCGWSAHGEAPLLERRTIYSVLSDRLLRRRNNTFVMVSYPERAADLGHANCSIFYGQFSERHEVFSPMRAYLPIRPSNRSSPFEFMAQYHPRNLDEVKRVYPGGVEETVAYAHGQGKLYTYTVSAQQVAAVYANWLAAGSPPDKEYYALTPQSSN